MVPATKKVGMVKVSEVKWTNLIPPLRPLCVPPANEVEMDEFLTSLRDVGHLCPAMALRAPHNALFVPKLVEVSNDVETLDEDTSHLFLCNVAGLFRTDYGQCTLEQLRRISADIKLDYSADEIQYIEQITMNQSNCNLWYSLRAGRITASNFKSVCRTPVKSPSVSLIKRICYPEQYNYS